MKLAILTTHPIQYNAPLFRLLHADPELELHVFYTRADAATTRYDKEFGQAFSWDIPLLEGYPYTILPHRGRESGFFRALNPGLLQAVKEFKPNALLVYGWDLYSHLRAMQYFRGKLPVLFRGDSTLLDETAGLHKILRRQVLRLVYRHVDYALYTGKANKQYFLTHGVPSEKLVFAPHAIDNLRFGQNHAMHEKKALAWRKSLQIDTNAIVVLFAGKFTPKKQPGLLLEAAHRINRPDVHFVLAGSGALEADLKAAASENVHFLPFQNQSAMPVLYRLGDLFVLPSKGPGETWGLAVNEAMASGRPALVSQKAGAAFDLILSGKNGECFNPFDYADFERKLHALLDKQKLEKMGRYAWYFIQEWNYQKVVKAIKMCM